jgi:hypothetical protein
MTTKKIDLQINWAKAGFSNLKANRYSVKAKKMKD